MSPYPNYSWTIAANRDIKEALGDFKPEPPSPPVEPMRRPSCPVCSAPLQYQGWRSTPNATAWRCNVCERQVIIDPCPWTESPDGNPIVP